MSKTGTQTKEYFNKKAISNSLMGVYEKDFSNFRSYWIYDKPLKKEESYSLTLGTVIDQLLTNSEEAKENIKVGNVPTGQLLVFINELAKTVGKNYEIAYKALEAKNGGSVRSKIDTFIKNSEEFEGYYNSLVNNNITLIDGKTMDLAKQRVNELKLNPYTSLIVNVESSENIDVYYQLALYYEWQGIPIKGALDKVIVDHKNKRVTLVDFKTSSNYSDFEGSCLKYNYFRQASFYTYLIKFWMEEQGIEDYSINDFLFVIISTISSDSHFIARIGKKDIDIARNGGIIKRYGRYVKGWEEILKEILYMIEHKNFKYPYEILISNGLLTLDIFKDESN